MGSTRNRKIGYSFAIARKIMPLDIGYVVKRLMLHFVTFLLFSVSLTESDYSEHNPHTSHIIT